jgi:hypothetical protein
VLQKRAYKLKAWTDHEDFLTQIAQATGKLTKGNEADVNTAAKMVLLDWQRGKLPFYSFPAGYPEEPPSLREEKLAAQLPVQLTDAPVRFSPEEVTCCAVTFVAADVVAGMSDAAERFLLFLCPFLWSTMDISFSVRPREVSELAYYEIVDIGSTQRLRSMPQ